MTAPHGRDFVPGIGQSVADRTITRVLPDGTRERWADVALRVAAGNAALGHEMETEFHELYRHMASGTVVLSGRHLQHGDLDQFQRPGEVMTNCATAAASWLGFYLLLNGSGVGRSYDDEMMLVDWAFQPVVVPVIRADHPDVLSGEISALTPEQAEHLCQSSERQYFLVPDSREGWAQAVERLEILTYLEERSTILLLDFSEVRERGRPIAGMQGRPASGPGPLMTAISNIARLRGVEMPRYRSTLYVDHYLAECVLVGGARRAARMATKYWKDAHAIEFASIKRGGHLWSANNSLMVDAEFWRLVHETRDRGWTPPSEDHRRAADLFLEATASAYHDLTGEPGLINVDRLTFKDVGLEHYSAHSPLNAERGVGQLSEGYFAHLTQQFLGSRYKAIVNPCGEVPLSKLGGYCVIGDVVPYHAGSDQELEEAVRAATRALIRVNRMSFLYDSEVERTNRIGVSLTGIHEYAAARFGYGWRDLVDEQRSQPFWQMLSRLKRAVDAEAYTYSVWLGVNPPHSTTTVKPAGTTSKLWNVSEGAHLPAMREYLRWVQFRNDDPLIEDYAARGYPTRRLQRYKGHTIVGFPTRPTICDLLPDEKLVTAAEATPEEQFRFIALLEKYWLVGVAEDGVTALRHGTDQQVSYTLKYDPRAVTYEQFREFILTWQPQVKCCSVMPQVDATAYEYQPEEPVTAEQYREIVKRIETAVREDIGFEHLDCASGACPIEFRA